MQRQEIPYALARLSDLKAIFWAEFFFLYRSRRTARGMSRRFQEMLTNVSRFEVSMPDADFLASIRPRCVESQPARRY